MVSGKALACVFATAALARGTVQAAPLLSLATTSANSPSPATYAPRRVTTPLGLTLATMSHAPDSSEAEPAPSPPVAYSAGPSTAISAPIPAVASASASHYPVGQATADAFLNLGVGPYASEGGVTAGNARPWFDSPAVARLFGGTPGVQQQEDFRSRVFDRVARTFNLSGVPIKLTWDPNVPAARSVSVVSGTYSPLSPGALGMTQVGGDGFSFIDQAARSAKDVDQLSWIVSHNVAHELMHAFGIQGGRDNTGQFIDSPSASFGMMVNPNATFSPSAARELRARDLGDRDLALGQGAQLLETAAVPEPATLIIWLAVGLARLRGCRRASIPAGG